MRSCSSVRLNEYLGFVQRATDDKSQDCGKHADSKHAPPADPGEEKWSGECGHQNSRLPSEGDVGGHACAHCRWPRLSGERHSNAELASQANARTHSE